MAFPYIEDKRQANTTPLLQRKEETLLPLCEWFVGFLREWFGYFSDAIRIP